MTTDVDVPRAPRRRRGLRIFLGIVAAFLVVLVLLVVFAPAIVGGMAPGIVEREFAARFHGRAEVERVSLSWRSPQAVTGFVLRDPDGREVARANVELPPLWSAIGVATGRRDSVPPVRVVASADVVTYADGTTNLERALAPREEVREPDEPREPGPPPRREELPGFDVEVLVERLTWRQEAGAVGEGAAGAMGRFSAAPIAIALRHVRGEAIALAADVTIQEPAPGNVEVRGSARELHDGELRIAARGLPLAELDALAALGGKLSSLVGGRADAGATFDAHVPREWLVPGGFRAERIGDASFSVDFQLTGERARAGGALALADGRIGLVRPIEVRLPADARVLAAFTPPEDPAAFAALSLPDDGVATLSIGELALDAADVLALAQQPDATGGPDPIAALARSLRLAVDVGTPGLVFAPEDGARVALAPARLAVVRAVDGPLTLEGRVEVREPEPSTLELHASVPLDPTGSTIEPRLGAVLPNLPLALVDAFAPMDGKLTLLLGERADVRVDVAASVPRAALAAPEGPATALLADPAFSVQGNLRLESPRARADGVVAVREGRLVVEEPLTFELAAGPGTLPALLPPPQPDAPPSPLADLAFTQDGRVRMRLAALEMPIADAAQRLFAEPAPPMDELVRELAPAISATLESELAGLTWRSPEGEVATVSECRLELRAPAGSPIHVDVSAVLAGEGDAAPGTAGTAGVSRVQIATGTLAEFAGLLAEEPDLTALPPITIDGRLVGLSTALLDRLLATDGLFRDVLGPRVEARIEGRELTPLAPEARGRVDLALASELATAETAFALVGTSAVAIDDRPLDLRFALTPLSSPRLVGGLVPMIATVEPTDPSQRAILRLDGFRLPLDGNLRNLDGRLTLDLGEVVPSLFPGAASALAGLVPRLGRTRLGPYEFQVQGGRAEYRGLRLSIDGRPFVFDGGVDLATMGIEVRSDVPLSQLGGEVGDLVQRARGLIDAETRVPVEFTGTWRSPRVRVAADAEQLLERAVQDALRGRATQGLGDVFRRLRDR